jgi:hypothetical protein
LVQRPRRQYAFAHASDDVAPHHTKSRAARGHRRRGGDRSVGSSELLQNTAWRGVRKARWPTTPSSHVVPQCAAMTCAPIFSAIARLDHEPPTLNVRALVRGYAPRRA